MPEVRKFFCCTRMPKRMNKKNMMVTSANKIKVTMSWGNSFSARINPKNVITPNVTTQKHRSFKASVLTYNSFSSRFFINPNITDMVINDTGKEKPKKKTSNCSFFKWISSRYSLFKITRLEIISPMERHSRDAW